MYKWIFFSEDLYAEKAQWRASERIRELSMLGAPQELEEKRSNSWTITEFKMQSWMMEWNGRSTLHQEPILEVSERDWFDLSKRFEVLLSINRHWMMNVTESYVWEEAIMDDRPITSVTSDLNDPEALTPKHLLLMKGRPVVPPGLFQKTDLYSSRRWNPLTPSGRDGLHSIYHSRRREASGTLQEGISQLVISWLW